MAFIWTQLTVCSSAGAKHNEVLGWYRMNCRKLKLPPLYAEIYDIPKCEELTNGHIPNGHVDPTPEVHEPLGINPPPGYHQIPSVGIGINGGFHNGTTEFSSPIQSVGQ